SRFVATPESSGHENFKNKVVEANEGDTILTLKTLTPVRLIKNNFYAKVAEAEQKGADVDELKQLLGKARAKKGMYEGDIDEGELEIGQVSGLIHEIKPAEEVLEEIIHEFNLTCHNLGKLQF
ncbi:MAG: NAD(P)H-dependent flavin oxidoreductase, partial [Bacteroidia bacterium]